MFLHPSWASAAAAAALAVFLLLAPARGGTDGPDVTALNVMYTSLNSPSQLTGWTSSGGDPCGQGWRGIKCSGSSVTEIKLPSLGLPGSLGYQLSSLTDLSKNSLQGDIPYQLPPNAVRINLGGNSFTGGVPYSISQMTDLKYLNLADNQLSGQLTDMYGKLPSLTALRLQNNQFTGPINVLASLPLEELNIENNQFTGWIPNELRDIEDLQTGGNSWSSGPAPPHSKSSGASSDSDGGKKNSNGENEKKSGVYGGIIVGILIAVLVVGLILLVLTRRRSSRCYIDEENFGQMRRFAESPSHEFQELKTVDSSSSVPMKNLSVSPSLGLKPPPSERHKSFNDDGFTSTFQGVAKRNVDPINATVYSFMDLQMATGSFGPSRILGEGSIGSTYKAKYADGKILAVKKLDPSHLRNCSSEDFENLVSGITQLHHHNIAELVGYCSESGHHLLVYEFLRNGSLHEFLHLSEEFSKPLTWDTRVRIALGTARAVEYLHETCSPPSIHKNIKSANILLDAELNPHLTECGLAALYTDTDRNLGPGYTAPECTKPSAYTLKSDVYSFGVVMLELLTGRMPFDSSKPRSEQSLVRWATPQLHDIDALGKMVDPALHGLYPPKSLSRFADVIALCVQWEPEFRPTISEVVQALVRCVQRRPSLNKRGVDLGAASRRSDDSDRSDYQW
ncbi:hypothetical protein Taro_018967 [Colocasia esculenta]|uniref:Protein kinase domain-containing protein n=1 Tax=Colocasia esculenta TaxID=4460 RepID=A0A843UJY3_COLES|nr:hypothetical protein [Colocasia esculenta]